MKKLGVTMQRLALMSVLAGMTSACWWEDDSDTVGSNQPAVEDMYPAIFMGDAPGDVIPDIRAELNELSRSDQEEFRAVVRAMAQIIALKDLTVTANDVSRELPDISPYDDLGDPTSEQFLGQFFASAADRLGEGGMTLESIKKIGATHEENAGTKYRNALFAYLEALKAKQLDIVEKDKQIKQVVAMVSFIQPKLERSGDKLSLSVKTQNSTELRLATIEVTVSASDPEAQFSTPEPVGSTVVSFDPPFEPGTDTTLDFTVDAPDYKGGPISLEVTKLSTASGFSVEASAMEEPLDLIDDLISDAEWARESVRDDLKRALERFP